MEDPWGGRYAPWVGNRLAVLRAVVRPGFWEHRQVLEVGAGHGEVSRALKELGAHVVATDARPEHVASMRAAGLDAVTLDLERDPVPLTDALVCWGVLYHLREPVAALRALCARGRHLFLETEVLDGEGLSPERNEHGFDQAANGLARTPGARDVEAALEETGFTFVRLDLKALESEGDHYAWRADNGGACPRGRRRFWIAWRRTEPSPLVGLRIGELRHG